jgi:hypothetical protein
MEDRKKKPAEVVQPFQWDPLLKPAFKARPQAPVRDALASGPESEASSFEKDGTRLRATAANPAELEPSYWYG